MNLFKEALVAALKTVPGTASAIAKAHGIPQSQMSAFTSGNGLPKGETLVLLCEAFQPAEAADLAQAWVRERLGTKLADSILSKEPLDGTELESLSNALPASTLAAFVTLMRTARDDTDFRTTIESLAAFMTPKNEPGSQPPEGPPSDSPPPDEPAPGGRWNITEIHGSDTYPLPPTGRLTGPHGVNEEPPSTPSAKDKLSDAKKRVLKAAARLKR